MPKSRPLVESNHRVMFNGSANGSAGRDRRAGRVRRDFKGYPPIVERLARLISDYVVLGEEPVLVLAAWTLAAYLIEDFDRFPHIAVMSPEKRSGKTTLLDVLNRIVPNPRYTSNISPAALYRIIEIDRPTLLIDESQSITGAGAQSSPMIREILNAGINKDAKVTRCGGERYDEIQEFSVYSPKVFAMIGPLDSVLADRCIAIPMERKTKEQQVERYRSRIVKERGSKLTSELKGWVKRNRDRVRKTYDSMEPFEIENDRMAELLVPLQSVLAVAGGAGAMATLKRFAASIDERDRHQDLQSPGVMLLKASREIFGQERAFLKTSDLIAQLLKRSEEPWARYRHGEPIGPEALASLLRQYKIQSEKNKEGTARGFYKVDFEPAWERYLPPLKTRPTRLPRP